MGDFLDHLNSINADIQFTSEIEEDGQIPFLDMAIKRNPSGSLSFGIYRKPTNSGRYLDFNSNHHIRHKRSVINSLRYRANKICSSEYELNSENAVVRKQLSESNYPNKVLLEKVSQLSKTEIIEFLSTTYIKGASEQIGKLLKPFHFTQSKKSTNTKEKNFDL